MNFFDYLEQRVSLTDLGKQLEFGSKGFFEFDKTKRGATQVKIPENTESNKAADKIKQAIKAKAFDKKLSDTFPAEAKNMKIFGPGPNGASGKFDTVKFNIGNETDQYGVILSDAAKNANAGNSYEDELMGEFVLLMQGSASASTKDAEIILKEIGLKASSLKDVRKVGRESTVRNTDILTRSEDVGAVVSDLDLIAKNGKVYHLSLKKTNVVNFLSGKTLPYITFDKSGKKIIFDESKFSSAIATDKLLSKIGFDFEKLASGLSAYYKKHGTTKDSTERKDNTDFTEIKLTPTIKKYFQDFIGAVYGYGYYYVHKIDNNNIHVHNLSTDADSENAAGQLKSVKVAYPNENTKSASIDVVCSSELFHADIVYRFRIRNPQGGIIPVKFVCAKSILKRSR